MSENNDQSITDINDDIAAGILSDRQAKFVFEYMKDQNASAAARRCGYAGRSAANQGNRLLNEPAVRDRIRIEMRGMLAALKLSVMDLIRERMRAAFFRNGAMFGADGRLLPVQEMDQEMRELLDISVEMRGETPVLRLKQPSREKALAALEKVHDKLDRLDEKYYDRLWREGAVSCLPEPDEALPPMPVRAEPGGSAREQPLDARPLRQRSGQASTSPGRTVDGVDGPEKDHHLSSSSHVGSSEKHHHSSSSAVAPFEQRPRFSSPSRPSRLAALIGKLRPERLAHAGRRT